MIFKCTKIFQVKSIFAWMSYQYLMWVVQNPISWLNNKKKKKNYHTPRKSTTNVSSILDIWNMESKYVTYGHYLCKNTLKICLDPHSIHILFMYFNCFNSINFSESINSEPDALNHSFNISAPQAKQCFYRILFHVLIHF